ncbi:peroxiredoxin-2E-2, chloroplastic-like [Salvia hispanica]|uniref:peroxiredoxin-2E-2, chloroplastic-like n=1 Tax=Salvia hispanica TaxID=49212 RepID=UPI002009511F|nr:peroxiredoxin-2E-2, chloroplastic-like [Salvia hispanica]
MAAATTSATSFSTAHLFRSSSLNLKQPLSLFFPNPRHRFPSKSLRFSAAHKISATISVGDKLPDAILSYPDASEEIQTISIADLTANKKAILVAVPGAFTPTCSQKHLPGFVEKAAEFKAKGIDTIACVSVNNAFITKAMIFLITKAMIFLITMASGSLSPKEMVAEILGAAEKRRDWDGNGRQGFGKKRERGRGGARNLMWGAQTTTKKFIECVQYKRHENSSNVSNIKSHA